MKRRVVVVSAGILSPAGVNWPEFNAGIFRHRDWFAPLPDHLPYPAAARVKDEVIDSFFKNGGRRFKYRRYYNRATEMGVVAACECLNGIEPGAVDLGELPVFWGAGPNFDLRAMPESMDEHEIDAVGCERRSEPKSGAAAAWMLQYLPNLAASAVSSAFCTRGEAITYVTACAASSHAVGEAFLKIRSGLLDFALCGGSDSRLNRQGLLAYLMLGALSSARPPRVLPFCRDRDGFVPGEGAAVFLLADESLALSRGLPILAEVAGCGSSSDGFRLTDPDPAGFGMERAMSAALRSAGASPSDIDIVNAHGTGTLMNDAAEARALRRLFRRPIAVTSNKSQFGHLSAAAGAIEMAACIAMLQSQRVTPTVNTESGTPEEGIDLVKKSLHRPLRMILSNSFGFGGQNSCLILKRWTS